MKKTNPSERKQSNMTVMMIALAVGIVIGAIFKALKLPVPVPRDFAGILGVMGMFIGALLVDLFTKFIVK